MKKSTRILNFVTRFALPPIFFIFLFANRTNDGGLEGIVILPLAWIALTQFLKFTIFPSKAVYEKRLLKELAETEEMDMVNAYRAKKKKLDA